MKRRLWLGILLLLTACYRNGASTKIDLTVSDYHYAPDTITVPAGEEITLNVDNKGFVSHQVLIFKLGTSPGEKFDDADKENVHWMFEFLPGRDGTARFIAPNVPGEYIFTCGIFGHLEAGMLGKLIVVEN